MYKNLKNPSSKLEENYKFLFTLDVHSLFRMILHILHNDLMANLLKIRGYCVRKEEIYTIRCY